MKCFTLTDMLIVMAILTVLMSLFVSSVEINQEKADLRICSENLHQIYRLQEQYLMDSDGMYPSAYVNRGKGKTWDMALDFYGDVESKDIYACPSDADINDRTRSYALNDGGRGSWASEILERMRGLGNEKGLSNHQSVVRKPDQFIAFAELPGTKSLRANKSHAGTHALDTYQGAGVHGEADKIMTVMSCGHTEFMSAENAAERQKH
ncbi:type II secretion system protein [Lentisphaera profundi]|uniref:Type II secretion system protein n=1 Tax=Lentisphaera profundi TaxID=1658616 RepID=A0ABY7VYW0_9BACT|nr:type II secretion system protein [Lentisphaera profundi]WDE99440.1 type II secretion system protein [Lentisphaera profundi]